MSQKNDHIAIESFIHKILTTTPKHSFLLYAGAGSGKTRTLVDVLSKIIYTESEELRLKGKRIAVITYTNAACDEIKRRTKFNHLIHVSTIHSFIWELIKHHSIDIKEWLTKNIQFEIDDLTNKQSKIKKPSAASIDRERKIESKKTRLFNLAEIYKFTYSPTGDNRSKDSLNHSEVIKIGAFFLENKDTMQEIMIRKYPILLIDESQDTNRLLMDAFLNVEKKNRQFFVIGLLGDMMQRIYSDGKKDLESSLDEHWKKPEKTINYRSPKRIVSLINLIRSQVDEHQQIPRKNAPLGFVRIFISQNNTVNKEKNEEFVKEKMAEITNDKNWIIDKNSVNTLILEHHMAASRMGFLEVLSPLYQVDRLKTGLLEGSLGNMTYICQVVSPLVKYCREDDMYSVTNILRVNSPTLRNKSILEKKPEALDEIKFSIQKLKEFIFHNNNPKTIEVLKVINDRKIVESPEQIIEILSSTHDSDDEVIEAWKAALNAPLAQFEKYYNYVKGKTSIDTHQGVKGLEFPRVLVLIDDAEAKGFLFSYDKLFGIKEKTKIDLDNENIGKETSEDRTRRLFYVTCSRAMKSLAILAYTDDTQKLKENLISKGWFSNEEIEIL